MTTIFDNPFLDKDYVQTLINFYRPDPNLYDVRILGKWGHTEGRIIRSSRIADDFPEDSWFTVVANGTDWGTAAPTATLHAGWNREHPTEIYVDEVVYKPGLNNQQVEEKWVAGGLKKQTYHVCDNNEPKTNKELYDRGWNIIDAQKGPDSVRWGMDYLSRFTIVFSKRSMNAIMEAQKWMRMKDRNGNFIDKEEPLYNHAMAALRYIGEYFKEFTERATTPAAAPKAGGKYKGRGFFR